MIHALVIYLQKVYNRLNVPEPNFPIICNSGIKIFIGAYHLITWGCNYKNMNLMCQQLIFVYGNIYYFAMTMFITLPGCFWGIQGFFFFV